jgi:hypothetical protein
VLKFLQEERAEVLLLEDEVVEEEIANSEAVVTVNSEAVVTVNSEAVVQEIPAEETGNSEVAENASPEVVDPEVQAVIANSEAVEIVNRQHQMILQKNEDRI